MSHDQSKPGRQKKKAPGTNAKHPNTDPVAQSQKKNGKRGRRGK